MKFSMVFLFVVIVLLIWVLLKIAKGTKNRFGKWGINLKHKQLCCPRCGHGPVFRSPRNIKQILWGGWTCDYCHQEIDKWGRAVQP